MKILLTGSSGLIGSQLSQALEARGDSVIRLVRTSSQDTPNTVQWDPKASEIPQQEALEGIDAVVHLAGENVSGRWTAEKKARIRDSRVDGTTLLARTLANLDRKPSLFICASAIGYYGDSGGSPVDEQGAPGSGFLASVCRDWEAATSAAADAGIRVVNTRFGMVLDANGGAMAKMLPVFRLGLGGIVGNGDQFYSWISATDAVRALIHLLEDDTLSGPVNLVAPNPVTNRQFTKDLGTALGKPTPFPMPGFLVRIAFGEMGEELLLASCRAQPAALQSSGFAFDHAELPDAFAALLKPDTETSG